MVTKAFFIPAPLGPRQTTSGCSMLAAKRRKVGLRAQISLLHAEEQVPQGNQLQTIGS